MESAAILSELVTIKWLLVALALAALAVAGILFFFVVNAVDAMRENRASRTSHGRAQELDELLASGQSTAAKFAAMEWATKEPRRREAHWALARAHYQLGELAEARQVLQGLLKVSPEEHYRVQSWLDLVESEFAERRPKSV
jgi:predicted Zn-dependent protease